MKLALALALIAAASCQAARVAPAAAKPAPALEMKSYWFALLRRGPNWTAEATPETQALGEGHMANIRAMHDAGKLVVAGPFLDQVGPDRPAGLFVLDVASEAEARELVERDPAVQARRFTVEYLKWLGPAALRAD